MSTIQTLNVELLSDPLLSEITIVDKRESSCGPKHATTRLNLNAVTAKLKSKMPRVLNHS